MGAGEWGLVGPCRLPRWARWTCDALPARVAAPSLLWFNLKQSRRHALLALTRPPLHYHIHLVASIKESLAPDSQRGTAKEQHPDLELPPNTTIEMDLAYDHIVEESLPKEEDGKRNKTSGSAEQTQNSLNAEFQDAYKAFSASPWGAKLGGFFGTVVKQVRLARRRQTRGREGA